jgi:dihydrodipicolinate synthase/N-acetylneuraminate lyase
LSTPKRQGRRRRRDPADAAALPAPLWPPSDAAIGFIQDVAEGADIDIVIHQYPSWTKVGYSLAEMLEMVKLPRVVCIKMGTRDMARWLFDYEQLKAAAPRCDHRYLPRRISPPRHSWRQVTAP